MKTNRNILFTVGAILGEYVSTIPKKRQPVIWIEDDLTLHMETPGKLPEIIGFSSEQELLKYAQDIYWDDSDISEETIDTRYYLFSKNSEALVVLHKCKSFFQPGQYFEYWLDKDFTLHIQVEGQEVVGYRCSNFQELDRVANDYFLKTLSKVSASNRVLEPATK